MNAHYEGVNIVPETDTTMNRSDVHADRFVDSVPVLAALIHDTPMGSGLAADGSLDEIAAPKAPVTEGVPYFDFDPVAEPIVKQITGDTPVGSLVPLLNHEDSEHLRTRWNEIQGWFVDEPRAAVQQADTLVSDVIDKIVRMFADERASLEGQWKQGDNVSTEDLRQALQHYRSFFNRLVV
ncbi:MAG TPA: hypothetical protein VN653_00345 [Anaerolineales bacterium]|nr:hypothetical protein [Anaerolineales bacterium]